jgi:VWFA-related protein
VSWLVLAAGLSAAQEPPAPPLFPAVVEQVVVDTVVLDERGAAVTGLSRDDFLLTEDGTLQRVVSFEAVEASAPAGGAQPALPSGTRVATNAASPSPAPRRTIVIVFDDLGLSPLQGERARAAVADFVRTEMAIGDQLSLASTSGRDRWVARRAEEIEDLLDVVSRLRGLASSDLSEQGMTDDEAHRIHVQHDPRTAAQVAERYRAAGITMGQALGQLVSANAAATHQRASARARQTLAALERSARSLQGMRGRKAVILVSPGFFYEPGVAEYRHVLEACREANVAVYFLSAASIDERTSNLAVTPVFPLGPSRPPVEGPPGEPGTELEALAGALAPLGHAAAAGSDSVADDTGGFVVRDANDLASGLRRMAEDSRAYYLLGYVSTNAARDGRYRKIRVRLSPRAGASGGGRRVRARRGYYGPTDAPPARAASLAEDELRRVLDSPVDRSDVPVRLATYTFEDSAKTPGTVRCLLVAEVDGRALTPPVKGGRGGVGLDVAYEILPRGGGHSERALRRVKLDPSATLARGWLPVEQEFLLPPGVHRVTVAVRDAASGRSGSASARVDVPPTGAFRISSPIVSVLGETDDKGRSHPTPAGGREFASGDRIQVAFDVYGAARDPGTGRPRVSMACAVVRATAGASSRARLAPVGADQGGSLHRAVDFELAGVEAGEYQFVARVVDEVAARPLTFTEPFAVAVAAEQRTADAPAPPATSDPELAALLEQAGRYVVEYEGALHDLAAEEEYTQHAPSGISTQSIRPGMSPTGSITAYPTRDERAPDSRRTRADVVFARLAPPFPWATFRDVYEVDGAKVRDRDGRLERAFRESPGTAVARAEAILAESARYNIGPERTVNLPTLPLLFLHPLNQARFTFELKGRGSGGASVEVAFREQKRPTMVRGLAESTIQIDPAAPRASLSGGDLPAEGRFWVDARRGTVLRSEVRFRFDLGGTATITTTYRAEPSLAMWVPAEMKERYGGGGFGAGTDAVARYSRFRKFQVTVEEGDVRLPPP